MALKFETQVEFDRADRRRELFVKVLKISGIFFVVALCTVPISWCLHNLSTNNVGDISQEEGCISRLLGKADDERMFEADPEGQIAACGFKSDDLPSVSPDGTRWAMYYSETEVRGDLLGACSRSLYVMVKKEKNGKFEASYHEGLSCSYWQFFP